LNTRNPTPLERRNATLELLLASVIWGFGFVATVWALKETSALGFLFSRFALAFLAGEFLRFLFFRKGRQFWNSLDFKLSIGAGLLMASFLLPQTVGLLFTSASNSGFLTILYVVLVPILGWVFWGIRYPLPVYGLALVAFIGAFLLMGAQFHSLNTGDIWTLVCALMAAVHILYVGKIAPRIQDSFRFNNYQSLWCLIAVIPLLPFDSKLSILPTSLTPWLGLLSTAIGSSLIGFMIQIRAQKVLSDTTASQLFLLESPFAMLFGFLILSEEVTPLKLGGAFLILLSSFLTLQLENGGGSTKSTKPELKRPQIP
jgi:drug/metabolite transporter (DMT)-like permease